MVGYVAKGNPLYAIVTDYVSAPLTQFVRDLAKEYSSLPVVDTRCGYACRYPRTTQHRTLHGVCFVTFKPHAVGGPRRNHSCSDHASWTKAGYPSTFPFETAFNQDNPSIHSPADTLDKISPEHALEFAKVALAFAVELSTQ
jgi:leucyl aminopeptidase